MFCTKLAQGSKLGLGWTGGVKYLVAGIYSLRKGTSSNKHGHFQVLHVNSSSSVPSSVSLGQCNYEQGSKSLVLVQVIQSPECLCSAL